MPMPRPAKCIGMLLSVFSPRSACLRPVPCAEEVTHSTAISSGAAPRVVLFHHIVAMNQWQHVVRDQLSKVCYEFRNHQHVSNSACLGTLRVCTTQMPLVLDPKPHQQS